MTEDNWLKLGDLGYTDDDGFVSVLGKDCNFITLKTGEVISPFRIEQRVRLELSCVAHAMVVGTNEDYLAVLLTLQTKRDENTGKMSNEMTEDAKRWFRFARYEVNTVNDVLAHLDDGLQHVIQAGIDRVNQGVRMTAHMISDWRIMPQFTYESGELGLTGKLKRSAILEKHATCIGSMFVHPEKHAYNSMCEAEMEAITTVKGILPQHLTQITEEDERSRASSRNSMDKDYVEKFKSQIAKEETSSIVESEDGVAKIHIGSGDVFKQFIEVNDNDDDLIQDATKSEDEHRKISGTMTPTVVEVYGR